MGSWLQDGGTTVYWWERDPETHGTKGLVPAGNEPMQKLYDRMAATGLLPKLWTRSENYWRKSQVLCLGNTIILSLNASQ